MSPPVVVLDACTLYPAALRDILMRLALHQLILARWTDAIHNEWIEAVLRDRSDLTRERLQRTRERMDLHAEGSLVSGYERRMPSKTKFKCQNCNELSCADARNRRHQRFCSKPECRRASKAASQQRWTVRPENPNYFKGPENCERSKQWRKDHPGYQRNKSSAPEVALQEISIVQSVDNKPTMAQDTVTALQDLYMSQPAVVIGFVSVLTGCVLQDDLMACARSFMRRGLSLPPRR